MPPDSQALRLAGLGWNMSEAADTCWLDCAAPGYLKTVADGRGRMWEIILCIPDALWLEDGAWHGDYAGARLPPDSMATAWPWRVTEEAEAS